MTTISCDLDEANVLVFLVLEDVTLSWLVFVSFLFVAVKLVDVESDLLILLVFVSVSDPDAVPDKEEE